MIDFTPDGPFAEKADPLFPGRVRLIGLGQAGAAVCDQVVLHGRPSQDLWVFDSDQQTIEGSVVPHRYLLGEDVVHGLGCSGDLDLAREIVLGEEHRLAEVVHGCDFLILVLGFAGSTGVALAEHLTQMGRKAGAKVIVVGVQPFAFEGWGRREKAIQAIASLRSEADSVLVLSHDRMAYDAATPKNIRHRFHLMHQLLARTLQALGQIVCKRGLIQLSFADVRSLYGRYVGSEVLENCWIAHVEGDIHDRTEDLIGQLLGGPLLADKAIWKHIDHAIVAVSGTRDLGLADVQEMVGALKDRLPVSIPIATSASLDDENHEKIRMTVFLAMTSPVHVEELGKAVGGPTLSPPKIQPINETVPLPIPMPKIAAAPQPVTETKTVSAKVRRPTTTPKAKPAALTAKMSSLKEDEGGPILGAEIPIAPTEVKGGRTLARQEEMQFEGAPRGRFEKSQETIYRGENLDQPTFRRRRLPIRL